MKKSHIIGKGIAELDWQITRCVTLTANRDKFESGEAFYDFCVKNKALNRFMIYLKRHMSKVGRVVGRTVWVREWHSDGFMHFHLYIEVSRKGKMIGNDVLSALWEHGMTYETYIKSAEHHKNISGYMQKHGYFDDGDKTQAELPEWGLDRKRIRRYGKYGRKIGERLPDGKKDDPIDDKGDMWERGDKTPEVGSDWMTKDKNRMAGKTYRERHELCGSFSVVSSVSKNNAMDWLMVCEIQDGVPIYRKAKPEDEKSAELTGIISEIGEFDVPYDEWKSIPNIRYVERTGLFVVMPSKTFMDLYNKYSVINRLNGFKDRIVPYGQGTIKKMFDVT